MARLSRRSALVLWSIEFGAVHVVAPLALSRWRRHSRRIRPANLVGLLPLAGGWALVASVLRLHYEAVPDEGWPIRSNLSPDYLLTEGPYRFSRNPMHVGGVAIWSGWGLLLGSSTVAAGAAALATAFELGVRWEERMLEERFGDEWGAYAARTPRWFAPPKTMARHQMTA